MFTLLTFYRSKEWFDLTQIIKASRDDICEHCERPIVKAYDGICHHKVELTEENVNDYNISLNPDNISLVHHRCHNIIHNKLGYSQRNVWLVYGPPYAGKSEFVDSVKNEGDLIVNIDNIWECISGCERYVKPPRLNAVVFQVRNVLLDAVAYRNGKWSTAYVIGGYPLRNERERLCERLGARELFIGTSKEECLAKCDDKDREKYIIDWWDRFF